MTTQRTVFAAVMATLLLAAPAHAIDKCKVKIDNKTGVLLVSASGVTGTLLWGNTDGAETETFFNAGSCVVADKAKKCEIADPATLAAKTPPTGCTLYLADDIAPCSVWIKGCTPGSRTEPVAPVCGDGQAGAGEACDGLDLNDQTCQSAGFLYGTLACDACALDTSGCTDDRFVDNGDSTITDNLTGLHWEQKSDDGSIHDKDNVYSWSSSGTAYDGTAVSVFLADLNSGGGFAGHTDWRLPDLGELAEVTAHALAHPEMFGPSQVYFHWSSTTDQGYPSDAWLVDFFSGDTAFSSKTAYYYVRAVRAGS